MSCIRNVARTHESVVTERARRVTKHVGAIRGVAQAKRVAATVQALGSAANHCRTS